LLLSLPILGINSGVWGVMAAKEIILVC